MAQLIAASDADAAYELATSMIGGLSDMNHDGDGDLTVYDCLGLN